MDKKILKIKNFRIYLLQQLSALSSEQWNEIPTGFNNNIIWNVAHMISAQQMMCYVRSNVPATVPEKYFTPYISGTKPQGTVDQSDIENIKDYFINTIDQLQLDYENRIFGNYTPSAMIPKVYGFEVTNIDDAIEYLLYHEGFHSGYVLSLKHLV